MNNIGLILSIRIIVIMLALLLSSGFWPWAKMLITLSTLLIVLSSLPATRMSRYLTILTFFLMSAFSFWIVGMSVLPLRNSWVLLGILLILSISIFRNFSYLRSKHYIRTSGFMTTVGLGIGSIVVLMITHIFLSKIHQQPFRLGGLGAYYLGLFGIAVCLPFCLGFSECIETQQAISVEFNSSRRVFIIHPYIFDLAI
jgi:hypothetical protein